MLGCLALIGAAGAGGSLPSPAGGGGHGAAGGAAPAPAPREFDPRSWGATGGSSEPAPIGVADLGQLPGGGSAVLTTDSFLGNVTIDSLDAYNASIYTEPAWISFQLNVYLAFDFGGTHFDFWVQDVMEVNSSDAAVEFFDNIWNATSPSGPTLDSSTVTGSGAIYTYNSWSYYADDASCGVSGICAFLTYPATVTLEMDARVGANGSPAVAFRYNAGAGLITFDTATFGFARPASAPAEFMVTPPVYTSSCPRCVNDAELVAGGPDSGYDTTLAGPTQVDLFLAAWNGNDYAAVPEAVDYGLSTAEGLDNAAVAVVAGPSDEPVGEMTDAAGSLGPLWNPSSISEVEVSVLTGTSGGTLQLNATPPVGYAGTFVSEVLQPGNYSVTIVSGGTPYPLGSVDLLPGEELTLEVGAPPVVFQPLGLPVEEVWSVELNGRILNGTGNLTFGEAPGTYSYSVSSLSGYSPNPSSGTVTVGANGSLVQIHWGASSPSLFAEVVAFVLGHLVEIGAGILIVLLVAALVSASRRRRPTRTLRPAAPGAAGFAVTRPPPRSPSDAYCPHCGAPRQFTFGACPHCGWRPPPAAPSP